MPPFNPGIYIGVKAVFAVLAFALWTIATIRGRTKTPAYWLSLVLTGAAVAWSAMAVRALIDPGSLANLASYGANGVYLFAGGAMTVAFAVSAGLAANFSR